MTLLSKLGGKKTETHRAVELFNFDHNGKITFNKKEIFPILRDRAIRNKKVCVVSIAGALRQGKSFILNFFIRYLRSLRQRNNNWMRSENSRISGFSWKPGSDRHTIGILMWSEIFLVKLPHSDEEIAVIIMDTQGTFDNETTITQCASIFALSVLLSSLQIYNLKGTIKQDDLSHLQLFSGYGRLISQSTNHKPFQKLLFLVRDWQWHGERTGFQGNVLLNDALQKLDMSGKEELKTLKNSITENFRDISCFLLPYPGEEVATNLNFRGNIDEISPGFIQQVEQLVPELLAPSKLVPKTVNNQPITVDRLTDLIDSYWTHFKDGAMPTLYSTFKATAEVHHIMALRDALRSYHQLMASCKSKKEAAKIREDVLRTFKSQKKLGDEIMAQKYQTDLHNEMAKIFCSDFKDTVEDTEVYSTIQTGVVGGAALTTLGTAAVGILAEATTSEILIACGYVAAGSLGIGFGIGCLVWGGYKISKWVQKKNE